MNNGLLQTLVKEDFGYKKEGRNWGRAEQHSSLTVNEESQKWFWNSQETGGGVLEYLIKVRGLSKKAAREVLDIRGKIIGGAILDEEEKVYYRPYEKLIDILWALGKGNREYWYDRKLTDSTIDRYRLGFYNGWYLIPLYDGDTFVDFQMRRDKPTKFIKMWYEKETWKPILVNRELLQFSDTIFITEGTVDAILLNQEGIPSVTQTNGANVWSALWHPLFHRVKNIYYIADNDRAGRIAARRVSQSIGEDRVLIYQFENKPEKYDTVDFFRDGGTAKEFRELVENNSQYLFEIGEINGRKSGNNTSFGKSFRKNKRR